MEYKVSIFCLTYNHVDTIRQALEGFISQKTNFHFNVLIYDDASDDGTSDIVREYAEKYPKIFDIFIPEENTYLNPQRENIVSEFCKKYATGKYIAVCEGDDFWFDNNKLQLEADFLDKNPDTSLVVHDAIRYDCRTGGVTPMHVFGDEDRFLPPDEFVVQYNGGVATASMMYRNKDFYMPEMFYGWGVGDIIRQFYSLTVGKIYYMSRIMSLCRIKRPGSWSESMNDPEKYCRHAIDMLAFLAKYSSYTNQKYEAGLISLAQRYINVICGQYGQKYSKDVAEKIARLGVGYAKQRGISEDFFRFIDVTYQRGFDEDVIDAEFKALLDAAKKIYIFGAGDYGTRLAQKLKNNGYDFVGFVNSSLGFDLDKTYLGKKVQNISCISDEHDNLVLMGVNDRLYAEVLKYVKDYQNTVIYWPFKTIKRMEDILGQGI